MQHGHEEEKQGTEKKQDQTIRIQAGQLGQKGTPYEITAGMTFGEFKTKYSIKAREVRLNRQLASDDTVLKEADMIVIVPNSIQGGLSQFLLAA